MTLTVSKIIFTINSSLQFYRTILSIFYFHYHSTWKSSLTQTLTINSHYNIHRTITFTIPSNRSHHDSPQYCFHILDYHRWPLSLSLSPQSSLSFIIHHSPTTITLTIISHHSHHPLSPGSPEPRCKSRHWLQVAVCRSHHVQSWCFTHSILHSPPALSSSIQGSEWYKENKKIEKERKVWMKIPDAR